MFYVWEFLMQWRFLTSRDQYEVFEFFSRSAFDVDSFDKSNGSQEDFI